MYDIVQEDPIICLPFSPTTCYKDRYQPSVHVDSSFSRDTSPVVTRLRHCDTGQA